MLRSATTLLAPALGLWLECSRLVHARGSGAPQRRPRLAALMTLACQFRARTQHSKTTTKVKRCLQCAGLGAPSYLALRGSRPSERKSRAHIPHPRHPRCRRGFAPSHDADMCMGAGFWKRRRSSGAEALSRLCAM
ncbi:hypothetical protein FA95DRAFT_1140042 [Auriscalpium vulgare]|uniref:Uncharacterized protein n=1 Tax=Auriscalpium vulgare TaxID=40419 RepID=A0ACB8RWR5_9AGAM|nr:hypothetical protein FA95DRAFT_1140042 [Auriscalpium vulgare]